MSHVNTTGNRRQLWAHPPAKLAVFALTVAAAIGGGALIGAAVGPDSDRNETEVQHPPTTAHGTAPESSDGGGHDGH